MKKTMKIVTILLLAVILVSFATNVLAAEKKGTGTALTPSEITPDYSGDVSGIQGTAGKVMGMIRNIAVIASVIIIMILGVKYMLGSVEEKAEYKKSFMPLIIGIILVVAASSIATFIFSMAG